MPGSRWRCTADGSIAEAAALAAEITGSGGRAVAFAADLAREDDVAALLPRAAAELGPVGVLVNYPSAFERDEGADRHPGQLGPPHGGQPACPLRAVAGPGAPAPRRRRRGDRQPAGPAGCGT